MLLHIADKTSKKDIFLHRNTLSSFLLVRSVKQGSSASPRTTTSFSFMTTPNFRVRFFVNKTPKKRVPHRCFDSSHSIASYSLCLTLSPI